MKIEKHRDISNLNYKKLTLFFWFSGKEITQLKSIGINNIQKKKLLTTIVNITCKNAYETLTQRLQGS